MHFGEITYGIEVPPSYRQEQEIVIKLDAHKSIQFFTSMPPPVIKRVIPMDNVGWLVLSLYQEIPASNHACNLQ